LNEGSPPTFRTIVAAKVVRSFGFGLSSVTLALYFGQRGLGPVSVGAMLTFALLAGAGFLMLAAPLARWLGRRGTLLVAAIAMTIAGLVLAIPGGWVSIVIACLMGTLSAGGQEVGPFAAIEQEAVVDCAPHRSMAYSFAVYNLAGAFSLALGALAAAIVPMSSMPLAYGACGAVLFAVYVTLPHDRDVVVRASIAPPRPRFGAPERLAALFGVDALAGGFVVQSFLAYWLHLRFGADQQALGILLFGANTLAAVSYLFAARLALKIGLLRTMVFTHLPSNVLLCIVPLMPSFEIAAVVLLLRFALSQMDVPTRQAFTMNAVRPEDRTYAASLTNAVRPAAAAIAPILSGLAMQTAAFGLPFFIAGGLKIAYDLAIFRAFKAWPARDST
jgi:MFS family permease